MDLDMERQCAYVDGKYNEHCDVHLSDNVCPAPATASAQFQALLQYFNSTNDICAASVMEPFDLNSPDTLENVWHSFWTIVPIIFWFALARVIAQKWSRTANTQTVLRFALEFAIIALPTIVSVNVANKYVEYCVLTGSICLLIIICQKNLVKRARNLTFDVGKRTRFLTLARATINYITVLCILAIDFKSFPTNFRKSRQYGAGLMDVGIGLFIFAMGSVSRRLHRMSQLGRLLRQVTPVLILGMMRTLVLLAIDYHQDEHEYGVHLNAFFTLGLTKLFGSLLSALARNDTHLLWLGLGTVAVHEIALQCGLSDWVMNPFVSRKTLWAANREGLCSLPGFVGIYLISMYLGQWLQQKVTYTFDELVQRIQLLALISTTMWLTLVFGICRIGIARITCNMSYTLWMFCIAISMTMFYMFIFELVLNTFWPVKTTSASLESVDEGAHLIKSNQETSNTSKTTTTTQLPVLVEAINQNGLVFFLVANLLTGAVNIFLKPENRTSLEGVVILLVYMFLSTIFVFILYRLKIRIA